MTTLNTQLNAEVHVRKLEDSLAEANSRLTEMERSQTELNTIKIHLSGTDSSSLPEAEITSILML